MRSISDIPADEILTVCRDWKLPAVLGTAESVISTIGELTAKPSHENFNSIVLLMEDLNLSIPNLCYDRYTRILSMPVNVIVSRSPILVTHHTTISLGDLLNATKERTNMEIGQFNRRVNEIIDGYIDTHYDHLMIPLNSLKSRVDQLSRENESMRRESNDLREDLSQAQKTIARLTEKITVIEAILAMITADETVAERLFMST